MSCDYVIMRPSLLQCNMVVSCKNVKMITLKTGNTANKITIENRKKQAVTFHVDFFIEKLNTLSV